MKKQTGLFRIVQDFVSISILNNPVNPVYFLGRVSGRRQAFLRRKLI
jgi:hypothetical protein